MRQGVSELSAFYASPLGEAARDMTTRKVLQTWGDCRGLEVLGAGYAAPCLGALSDRALRSVAVMPPEQGAEAWPSVQRNRTVLAADDALPFPNARFDRILLVHALEESPDPDGLLREMTRVLAPAGRLIAVAAARNGPWAPFESTPFGHGRPFSRRQLAARLREAGLEPTGWTRALYLPPLPWLAGWAEGFERAGSLLWPPLSGLVLMEAVKQTLALQPRAARAVAPRPVRRRAAAGARPQPAGRDPAGA
jgi:SAM-dependent methyltransferase